MKIIDIIKIAINSSENLSKEKRKECIKYINDLQQENARLKDKIENATKLIEEIKLHYQKSPTMIPNVKINKLEDLLKEN